MKICPRCMAHYPDAERVCSVDGQTLVPEETLKAGDPELPAGTKVGEYVIEEKIAEGGFGTVYRATHPVIGKAAAIKILHSHRSANPQMVARFISEARAVNQIGHPNIVDIFAFGKLDDDRRYYVMELLPGMPLERYLRMTGAIPPSVALPLMRGVARALSAAHEAGIVHRDLKPDNIFVVIGKEGGMTLKLLDFGIAKLFTEAAPGAPKTRTGAPMGTPHYMSPQQCRGKPVDHRTDIYSFGIVLHRVLTGHLPFDSDDPVDLLTAQVSSPAPPMSSVLPTLPAALDAPVLRMLEKDPDKRPPTMAAAMEELFKAAALAGVVDAAQKTPDGEGLLLASPAIRLDPKGNVRLGSSKDVSADPTMVDPTDPSAGVSSQGGGASREAHASSRRRWLLPAGVLATLGIVVVMGLRLARPGETAPPREAVTLVDAAPAPEVSAPSAATSRDTVSSAAAPSVAQPAPPSEVTITISSVPVGTKVYLGDRILGTAPGPVRLAQGAQKVTLRFVAEGYRSAEIEVIPDIDHPLSVNLTRNHISSPPAATPKVPNKDLEPFN